MEGKQLNESSPYCKIETNLFDFYSAIKPPELMSFWANPHGSCPRIYRSKFWARIESEKVSIFCKNPPRIAEIPKLLNISAFRPLELSELPFRIQESIRNQLKQERKDLEKIDGTGNLFRFSPDWSNSEAIEIVCDSREEKEIKDTISGDKIFLPFVSPNSIPPNQGKPNNKLNVLILMIDSVSRKMFKRRMKETEKAINEIAKEAEIKNKASFFEFFRYHSVGVHTITNIVPLFSNNFDGKGQSLWDEFNRAGYETWRLSNMCYDMREYFTLNSWFQQDLSTLYCAEEYHDAEDEGNIWKGPYSIRRRCLGEKMVHEHLISQLEQMIENNQQRGGRNRRNFFTFATFFEAHEPTTVLAKMLDKDLAQFVRRTLPSLLDSTVVVFLADHGLHSGMVELFTKIGQQEHFLPFGLISFPNSLLDSKVVGEDITYRKRLQQNEQKLITAFDLHETLHEISTFGDDESEKRKNKRKSSSGISLFREIPANRSCESAGIRTRNCKCYF